MTRPGVYSILQHDALHCQLLWQITCSRKYQHIHVQIDRAGLHAAMQCTKRSMQGLRATSLHDRRCRISASRDQCLAALLYLSMLQDCLLLWLKCTHSGGLRQRCVHGDKHQAQAEGKQRASRGHAEGKQRARSGQTEGMQRASRAQTTAWLKCMYSCLTPSEHLRHPKPNQVQAKQMPRSLS